MSEEAESVGIGTNGGFCWEGGKVKREERRKEGEELKGGKGEF